MFIVSHVSDCLLTFSDNQYTFKSEAPIKGLEALVLGQIYPLDWWTYGIFVGWFNCFQERVSRLLLWGYKFDSWLCSCQIWSCVAHNRLCRFLLNPILPSPITTLKLSSVLLQNCLGFSNSLVNFPDLQGLLFFRQVHSDCHKAEERTFLNLKYSWFAILWILC